MEHEINRQGILDQQIYKPGDIFNDRVAFTGSIGNKNIVPEDNRPITAILNEIYAYINEDLSVLPNPAGPDVLSRTPNQIKSYLNPAGLKHLTSLMNEVFLLKIDKRLDQLWHDGIYYTGHMENYGTVMLMDIMPKEDENNPFPDSVINHFQFYADALQDWHISAHNRSDTGQDTDIIGDHHHGKISFLTTDVEHPIIKSWEYLLNDVYERTEDIQSNLGDPETVATMDPDSDNLYLVVNQAVRTTVKQAQYMSRTARTIDQFARILQDGKHGRSWLLDSRENIRYYNQLTLRMDYKPGMDTSQLKEPQTIARIIDIPVHTRDLENIHPTIPSSHGSKDKDDTNFDFYLPYSDERDGSKYLGVENREEASVDDYYCKKNDFNWFWNHYNNKMKYIDYDRNQLWTAINRLRNTGTFLGYVYEYSQSRDSTTAPTNTPGYSGNGHTNNFPDFGLTGQRETRGSSSVPAYSTTLSNLRAILEGHPNRITRENPGRTTWQKLRQILSCDEHRVVFDNDFFIVQHNNDADTFEPYSRTTGAFNQSMFSETNNVRLDYDYIISVYGSLANYLNRYYWQGTPQGSRPPTSSLQNVITNRVGSESRQNGTIQIRQTKPWEDTKSQMGDFYTYKARVYRVMNMDPNQYRKDGNDGRPGDIPILIYPDTYLDQMGRVFCDPQQPLGRGRIKTLEIEDNAVTMEKLDLWLQYFIRQSWRPWIFYANNAFPPCGDVSPANANPSTWPNAQEGFPGIYDYRTPGNNPLYTSPTTQGGVLNGRSGCNIAFNAYTRVIWICVTDYTPTKVNGNTQFGALANRGFGTWVPSSGTIYP